MSEGPDPASLGPLVAEHLGPILFALEVCAVSLDEARRPEDAAYYRSLARRLADAGGTRGSDEGPEAADPAPG